MEGTLSDLITQGVDAFITAAIVSFLTLMLAQQQLLSSLVSENQSAAMQMREYREYNAYDHKHVYAADVISVIMRKKGYPEVKVDVLGTEYTFNVDSNSIPYNVDLLYQSIDPKYLYNADLIYEDPTYRTGVKSIVFKACNNSSCGY